jgi:glycosyltransferase involved in cell wall biosynthesis
MCCPYSMYLSCLHSLMEGLGLSVMEAQAAGIPVVASNVGGLPDLIEDGKNGYLVPPGNPEVLAARIVSVLKDPAQAKAMAKIARANIEQKFSSQDMVKGTVKVYEQYSRR